MVIRDSPFRLSLLRRLFYFIELGHDLINSATHGIPLPLPFLMKAVLLADPFPDNCSSARSPSFSVFQPRTNFITLLIRVSNPSNASLSIAFSPKQRF